MASKPAAVLALALLPLASGCSWLNRKLLYVPSRELVADPFSLGLYFEDVVLRADDGPRLHGWWVPAGPKDAPVVVFFHGNGGNISHRLERLRLLRAAGASVFMFDYRGYGRSEGKPSEDGTYRDAEAALRWLESEKHLEPSRLVYHGESLGCGVAVELARRRPPAGLVFDSGFTSVLEMGRKIFPHLPVSWLVRYKYDNLAKIKDLHVPLLVLHSPQDDIVPYEMGRRIFETANEPKTFVNLRGGHNEAILKAGPAYVDAMKAFLAGLKRS